MISIRNQKNALKSNKPASWWGSTWREGFPTGNGMIGASVYGGACDDVVMITHGDLWWQGHVGVLQDVADKMTDVRKKVADGKIDESAVVLSKGLISKGYRPMMSYPLPLCDFNISMPIEKTVKEYQRVLNMENGEVSVSFKDGSTKYDRSCFVSRAKDIICYEIIKAGQKNIEVKFSFNMHNKFYARTPQSPSKLPEGIDIKYENFFMYFNARSDNGADFGCIAKITFMGGSQKVDPLDGITISGAEKILVIIKPYIESQKEKEWKNGRAVLTAEKLTYEKLLKEHTAIHSKLFGSAEVEFEGDNKDFTIDELLNHTVLTGEISPALSAKLWAFGRYLMVTSTSPQGQPCAPCGLWCGDYKGVQSCINASGQLQNMYNQVFSGNLCDFVYSIYNYYSSQFDDLKKNASRLYGCRGIMIPSIVARGTGAIGDIDPSVINFVGAGAWICGLLFDYYQFSSDIKFLKEKIMPFMKDVFIFYSEFLKISDGEYEIVPSFSPDAPPSNYGKGLKVNMGKNSALDISAIKELLTNLIAGSKVTGQYKDEVSTWEYMLTRLPKYAMGETGYYKDYCDSDFADSSDLSATGLFYSVFPGIEIIKANDVEVLKKYLITAEKRYAEARKNHTAASITRYANIFARLKAGDNACQAIIDAVRNMSMNNLILASNDWRGMGVGIDDVWATYSLEANMNITNAIQEMIVQSTNDSVILLPAFSGNLAPIGSISNFLTRVGVQIISLSWNKKKGIATAKLKAKKQTTFNVQLPQGASYKIGKGKETFNPETGLISGYEIAQGKTSEILFRF